MDPCYLFMACYYLERQSIERQIDISGVKGISSTNADGVRKVHLNDVFSVFSKVTAQYLPLSRNFALDYPTGAVEVHMSGTKENKNSH